MKKFISNFLTYEIVPFLIYTLMRIIWFTIKKEFPCAILPNKHKNYVCACWHSELLISPQYYRKLFPKHKTGAIASSHKDGKIVSNTLKYFDTYPIEGSTSKGGVKALINSLNALKNGDNVMITPDGPKGPRFTISDGTIALAQKSNLEIFMINFQAHNYWQLKSWDKFVIPKPFSKVTIYSQIIDIQKLTNDEAKNLIRETMLKNTTI
ncbi:MAG: lysophospholipid acyltransferase family protein [Sulfurovaceae bacterium]|nr:lysophospholipid acyltransferase family protein [Sulfurovaceae bacterium]MDD5548388.1 lysophospholipid acyltransferase family protein [Sulfurovaceae bacterium]